MKKIFMILPALFFIESINSQVREIESRSYYKQGNWDFNISSNIGIGFSETTETTTQNYYEYDSTYNEYSHSRSERPFGFILSAAAGYSIIEGLTIEPELDINFITDADISLSLLGNITYAFNIPRKNIYPFIKIGYGLSNYRYGDDYVYQDESGDNSLDTKVINAGAGLKFVYSSGMALKMEINYKNYNSSFSRSFSYPGFKQTEEIKTKIDMITISIGFSILL